MPVGQRIAHMAPKGRRRIRDLRGELVVGAGDALPKVEAGKIGAPVFVAPRSFVSIPNVRVSTSATSQIGAH
jgi:hypothetical protein